MRGNRILQPWKALWLRPLAAAFFLKNLVIPMSIEPDEFTAAAPAAATAPPPQATPAEIQQRYRQFLELMPMTLALAGLPTSEGRLYSEEQIEGRAVTIRMAYRVARSTTRDILGGS